MHVGLLGDNINKSMMFLCVLVAVVGVVGGVFGLVPVTYLSCIETCVKKLNSQNLSIRNIKMERLSLTERMNEGKKAKDQPMLITLSMFYAVVERYDF